MILILAVLSNFYQRNQPIATRKFLGCLHSYLSLTSDASSEILTSNNGGRVWAVPFTVGRATNSPILRVFTKKAKALCKGRLIKPAHPRSKAWWISPFPLISAERRSYCRFPAKESLIVILNGSRHWSSTIIYLWCVPFAVHPSSVAKLTNLFFIKKEILVYVNRRTKFYILIITYSVHCMNYRRTFLIIM